MRKNKIIFYIFTLVIVFLPFILWTNSSLGLIALHEKVHWLGGCFVGRCDGVIVGSSIQFDNPNPFEERKVFRGLFISGMPHFIGFNIFWMSFLLMRLNIFQKFIFREFLHLFMAVVSFDFIGNFVLMFPSIFRFILHEIFPSINIGGNDFLNLFFRSAVIDRVLIGFFCFAYLFLFLRFLRNQFNFRIKRLELYEERKKFQFIFYILFSIPLLLLLLHSIQILIRDLITTFFL